MGLELGLQVGARVSKGGSSSAPGPDRVRGGSSAGLVRVKDRIVARFRVRVGVSVGVRVGVRLGLGLGLEWHLTGEGRLAHQDILEVALGHLVAHGG